MNDLTGLKNVRFFTEIADYSDTVSIKSRGTSDAGGLNIEEEMFLAEINIKDVSSLAKVLGYKVKLNKTAFFYGAIAGNIATSIFLYFVHIRGAFL